MQRDLDNDLNYGGNMSCRLISPLTRIIIRQNSLWKGSIANKYSHAPHEQTTLLRRFIHRKITSFVERIFLFYAFILAFFAFYYENKHNYLWKYILFPEWVRSKCSIKVEATVINAYPNDKMRFVSFADTQRQLDIRADLTVPHKTNVVIF